MVMGTHVINVAVERAKVRRFPLGDAMHRIDSRIFLVKLWKRVVFRFTLTNRIFEKFYEIFSFVCSRL